MTTQHDEATDGTPAIDSEVVVIVPAARRDSPFIFWALAVLVALMPLPLASVYAWSWALEGCIVALLLIAWAVGVLRERFDPPFGLRALWPLALPFAMAITWAMLQTSNLTPNAWHHPLWWLAGDALSLPLPSSISINTDESWSVVARLLTYAGIFFLSVQFCRRVTRTRQVFRVVVMTGFCYAIYGLIQKATGSNMILWLEKTAYEHDLTSTFVNRNSYAAFAGIALISATGLIIKFLRDVTTLEVSTFGEKILRAVDEVSARGWLLIVAWGTLLTALMLAHSRGGFASSFIGVATLIGLLTVISYIPWRVTLYLGGAAVAGLIVFLSVSGGNLQQRLAYTDLQAEQRPVVYQVTLDAIADAPMLGTGLGTFGEVFRFYRTEEVRGTYTLAHNTYLENALELGVPGALGLFAVIGGFLVLTGCGIVRRRYEQIYPAIGFAVTILLAVHSLIDFSLQIPAIAGTYALVMGAACAQSFSTRRPPDPW